MPGAMNRHNPRLPGEPLSEAAERVAIDAVYDARNAGGNMHDAGASAAAAVLALLEPINEHIVDFDEEGFTVTHPLTERTDGTMHLCSLHQWLRSRGGMPVIAGRYVAEQFSDGTWQFDRVSDDRGGDS